MPGIVPRIKGLFTSGFGYIAFLMAQIYAMTRLLPNHHAYLNPDNIGKFSIRHVIAEAANNLTLKKENIDQIVIFAALLIGLVLLVIQFAMILLAIIFEPAIAAFPTSAYPTGESIFITPGVNSATGPPTFDIAYMLLDQVFGVPDFFNSCIAQGVDCGGTVAATPIDAFPWPFHTALHELFQFYNTGILVIGALIFLYFIVIVVGETAVTGTPFGQRFQNVWVPIRLVMAIGLLIPLNFGFNSGQYITLFAAKTGSAFATNGWITYNNAIAASSFYENGAGANPTGERESLIGNPKTPDVSPILEAMSIVRTCAMAHWHAGADAYTRAGGVSPVPPREEYTTVRAYLYKDTQPWMEDERRVLNIDIETTYEEALAFYNNSDITIRFGNSGLADGEEDPDVDSEEATCGEMRINIHQVGGGEDLIGTEAVQKFYYETVRNLWFLQAAYEMDVFAFRYSTITLGNKPDGDIGSCGARVRPAGIPNEGTGIPERCEDPPEVEWKTEGIADLTVVVQNELTFIWDEYTATHNLYQMTAEILQRGWAGAGIWYNTIARINGNYMSAVRDIPFLSRYPIIMEEIADVQLRENESLEDGDRYCANEAEINAGSWDVDIATVLCSVYKYWNEEVPNPTNSEVVITGSIFEDTMNLIFGTQPLSSMTAENVTTHPLTQLAMLGKGLVDASIRNVAVASASSAIGGLGAIISRVIPNMVNAASSFILSTAFVGLTAGLVLYYIVPFLPFVYFFFAVTSWVKSIFEAMVGVPLWALAHLRIDGEGLPGNSAANGYFLLFEIFLRPILTIFGLVAATLIFTAQVRVLHFLWSIVTENLTGFDNDPTINVFGEGRIAFKRSIVDQFFFQVIYAIIVYMMAIAAFKLIDKIPDNLLRWMGSQVSAFGDMNQEDGVEGLSRYAALSGATAGQSLARGVQTAAQQTGGSVGNLLSRLNGAGP